MTVPEDRAEDRAEDARDLLLDYAASPRRRGRAAGATHAAARRNPLCGDEVLMTVRVEGGRAAEVRWEGRGCVLSRASAARLCESAEGRPVAELAALPDAAADAFGLPLGPAKRACAALPLAALKAALEAPAAPPPAARAANPAAGEKNVRFALGAVNARSHNGTGGTPPPAAPLSGRRGRVSPPPPSQIVPNGN